jgi:hypothetical protein
MQPAFVEIPSLELARNCELEGTKGARKDFNWLSRVSLTLRPSSGSVGEGWKKREH